MYSIARDNIPYRPWYRYAALSALTRATNNPARYVRLRVVLLRTVGSILTASMTYSSCRAIVKA